MKAEIIKDKLHLFPSSPTEQYAIDMWLEYNRWVSLRDIVVLPNPYTDREKTLPEEKALLDEISGKIENPVQPALDNDDPF